MPVGIRQQKRCPMLAWSWLRDEPRELLRRRWSVRPSPYLTLRSGLGALILEAASNRALAASAMPLGNEFHNRMRSTSLNVISSFVRS
jgi:hypothetical protein